MEVLSRILFYSLTTLLFKKTQLEEKLCVFINIHDLVAMT